MDSVVGSDTETCCERKTCIDTVVKYDLVAESACIGLTDTQNTLQRVSIIFELMNLFI